MLSNYAFLDLRIVKSKVIIKESLLKLLLLKEIENITVSDIVLEAQISRVTFYNHYDNKNDLIEELINDIVYDFIKSYTEASQTGEGFRINELSLSSVKMFDHVYNNKLFYSAIIDSNLIITYTSTLISTVKEVWENDYKLLSSNIDNKLYIVHSIYGIIGLIVEWIQEDFKYSPEYMTQQLFEIKNMTPSQSIQKVNN